MGANIGSTRGRKGRIGIARRQIGYPAKVGADLQQPYIFGAAVAAYSFVPPVAGRWKFVGWGPGGGGSQSANSGASGGYFEITAPLNPSQTVSITVGRPTLSDTSVVLPDGRTATATRGGTNNGVAGTATGGDVNLAGTAGSTTVSGATGGSGLGTGGGTGGTGSGAADGGAGAPANLPFRGGQGGAGGSPAGAGHGAGAGDSGTTVSAVGGPGLVIATLIGD